MVFLILQRSGTRTHPPSLSSIPVEIFDEILYWVSLKFVIPLLLSNKETAQRVAQSIYRKARPFTRNQKRSDLLFNTLLSSAKGMTSFPYHSYMEHLSLDEWHKKTTWHTERRREVQELYTAILPLGRLRYLDFCLTELVYVRGRMVEEANVGALKSLKLNTYKFSDWDRTWLQTTIPKMPLLALHVVLSPVTYSLDDFKVQPNTMKSLIVEGWAKLGRTLLRDDNFAPTFLAPHCNSLTSMSVYYMDFKVDSRIAFPNLKSLSLWKCRVEGWEELCQSLTALKHLYWFGFERQT